ncbi:META domain-containing protein [uncultured Roseobacter sp.]|uniref:META domain-containing protein n=1 Tax=uncultured Roseobacter sp. TaxID=114847 RepID=UPI002609736F|nr:META domain-containing protein [uncultured Roseobacter sp.]
MTLRTGILTCCCVLLATAACRKDETVAAYGGSDRIWQLTEIDGDAFAAEATLTFPETGKIAGTAPCNSYSAAMTVPYPWFGAGPIAATRRACPALEAETIFFKTLGEMTLSEVLGDTLVLSTPEGRSMIFISGG